MMKRDECFRVLARHVAEDVVVATYSSAFDWIAVRKHPLNYLSVGAMGLASSHGLGLALGRPDRRIIVLDGDGSLLMNLGTLVTIAEAKPRNLFHFICENGNYEANGGHPIPMQGRLSFVGLARSAGIRQCYEFSELVDFERQIGAVLLQEGPVFVDLKVERGSVAQQDFAYIHSAAVRTEFQAALRKA